MWNPRFFQPSMNDHQILLDFGAVRILKFPLRNKLFETLRQQFLFVSLQLPGQKFPVVELSEGLFAAAAL